MRQIHSLQDLVSHARDIVEPFAVGRYVPDWERRAAVVSVISDYLLIRLRDDAFVEDELANRPLDCDADVGYRAALSRALRANLSGEGLAFPEIEPVSGRDAATLNELCSTLDYAEKIVISATALAMRRFSSSVELLSVVANILFEEAYHLKIITDMLGLDQSERPWLAPDKATNWQLVSDSGDLDTYMLLEHLLFEVR